MLASECGFTPAQVGEMTLIDIRRLSKYWQNHPSSRALLAALCKVHGVEIQPAGDKPKPMTREEFARMVQQTGGQIPGVRQM